MDKLVLVDATQEEIELIEKTEPIKKLENIFKDMGAPKNKVNSIEEFKEILKEDEISKREWNKEFNSKYTIKIDGEVQKPKEVDENEEFAKEEVLSSDAIKTIYCYYDAYTDEPVTIKVTRPDPSVPLTNFELLALYTRAFQWIYEEEEREVGNPGHLPGMENRAPSHGRYGLWGHDLSDLVYNGFSDISIYKDFIYCEFRVDS